MEKEKGIKHDQGKVRMELLSTPFLVELSKALTFGATKYSDHNWRNGFKWSRLYGALLRHVTAHMAGEDKDSESSLSHLSHASACLMMLVEHEAAGIGEDDRHKVLDKHVKLNPEAEWVTSKDANFIKEHEIYQRILPGDYGINKEGNPFCILSVMDEGKKVDIVEVSEEWGATKIVVDTEGLLVSGNAFADTSTIMDFYAWVEKLMVTSIISDVHLREFRKVVAAAYVGE